MSESKKSEGVPTTATQTREEPVSLRKIVVDLLTIGRMIFDPGFAAYEAAKMGARMGEVFTKHDPCTSCSHGRLLHRRQAYVHEEPRARDEALSATRCRQGHHAGGVPCACERWEGVETPLPKDVTMFMGSMAKAERRRKRDDR